MQMASEKPDQVLTRDEYKNYRNIRAIALLFILLGTIFLLAGVMVVTKPDDKAKQKDEEELPLIAKILVPILGFCGVLGGIAIRRGERSLFQRFTPLPFPICWHFPSAPFLVITYSKDWGSI